MNFSNTFYRSFLCGVLLVNVINLKAQTTDFDSFLRAGTEDANTLIGYYLEPIVVGFSYGMANSWYNSAETHDGFGIDFMISANLTSVPNSKEYFVFDPSEFSNVESTGTTNQIPTIMSPNEENGAELSFAYTDETTGQTVRGTYSPIGLGMEEQVGFNVVPSPMLQLGIGTFKKTNLIIRYTPSITYNEFKTSMFGLGIKHDIMQWFPGLKRVPIDVAVLAGFSGINNRLDLSQFELEGSGQVGEFSVNNWTVQGIVSKKISVLTIYIAGGYSDVSSSLAMKGQYIIEDMVDSSNNFTVEDPVDLSYQESSWRFTGGAKLNFGPVFIHADYSWQAYPVASGGLGFEIN
jgi:hypothetical protein